MSFSVRFCGDLGSRKRRDAPRDIKDDLSQDPKQLRWIGSFERSSLMSLGASLSFISSLVPRKNDRRMTYNTILSTYRNVWMENNRLSIFHVIITGLLAFMWGLLVMTDLHHAARMSMLLRVKLLLILWLSSPTTMMFGKRHFGTLGRRCKWMATTISLKAPMTGTWKTFNNWLGLHF